ncbi:MAG: hypothetical protein AMXMBFR33_68920 [Candidatus Xenobia bacterium]
MITATRATESKKAETTEKPRPAEAPRAAAARTEKPAEKPAEPSPARPATDRAEVSQDASQAGEDDSAVLDRVRQRVAAGQADASESSESEGPTRAERPGGEEPPVSDKEPTRASAQNEAEPAPEPTPEEQALENLDRYGDLYDNPGNADDPDGIISEGDLEEIASGDYDRDEARAYLEAQGVAQDEIDATLASIEESAGVLLEDDDLRNELDTANDSSGDPDGDISRSDISAAVFERQLEQAREGTLPPGESASNRDSYEEVETMDERDAELIQQQEATVLEAVDSGQPVEFTNANGETEMVTINQVTDTGGNTVYELTGEDGHTIRIESELGATDNRTALARITDYYTQLPPGVRPSVDEIALLSDPKDGVAADYRRDGDKVRFYDGLEHLNEEVFDHEYGHGVGYEVDGEGEGFFDDVGGLFGGQDGQGAPDGWEDAIEQDAANPSDYADTNYKEDFAESWAAYLEAREQGPEALEQLMEAYPARFEILEQIYEQAAA